MLTTDVISYYNFYSNNN